MAFTQYEKNYARLVERVLTKGKYRSTRNANTVSCFDETLVVDLTDSSLFPILQGRKMYPAGVLGELAAMFRGPKHINDFKAFGCNYWDKWAKEDGSISIDYGNAWHANGQLDHLRDCLINNPTDRRMLISGWRPERLAELDLPCCHYAYQFYVRDGKYLDLMWIQRSADVMVGVPSDVIFAAAMVIAIASWAKLKPGRIKLHLGDTHIYQSHVKNAHAYIARIEGCGEDILTWPGYRFRHHGHDFTSFVPDDLKISEDYDTLGPLEFELYA